MIVGTLDWDGSWTDERGPVLASGAVDVPDAVAVSLDVQAVRGSTPIGKGSWSVDVAMDPVDLRFLLDLPAEAIESLTLGGAERQRWTAHAHL